MKYEFLSQPWFAALHGILAEKANAGAVSTPDLSFSICEVFTGVPHELASMSDGRTAWSAKVEGPDVAFALVERDDVDLKVIADYGAIRPLAVIVTLGDPAQAAKLQELSAGLVKAGKLSIARRPEAPDQGPFASLHDAIARLTQVS